MKKNTRFGFIDLGKSIAIIFILLIHNGFSELNNVVLFAMPLFFFSSGYLFTPGKRTLRQTATAQFRKILVPFWGLMIVYAVIELIRAPYIGYGEPEIIRPTINAIYGSSILPNPNGIFDALRSIRTYNSDPNSIVLISPTYCHLWFLPAFFTASIIFSFIVERVRKLSFKVIAIIALVFLSSLESVIPELYQLPYGIGRGFMGAAFMLVGFEMRKVAIFESVKRQAAIPLFIIGLCVAVASILLGSTGSAYIASYYGEYGIFSTYLTFIGGLGALFCVLYICKLLCDAISISEKSLSTIIGRNTMSIYGWHFLIIFILDVLYINIFSTTFKPDAYYMALLPVDTAWWYILLKVVAIIAICIIGRKCFKKEGREKYSSGLHLSL